MISNRVAYAMKSSQLILPHLKERRYFILIGLVSLIIVDVLQLIIPRIIKWAVDDLTLMRIDPGGLLRYFGYFIAVGALIGVFRYVWRRCLLGTSRRIEEALRNQLFDHLQTLSATYFDKTKSGDLMAHATNDIQQVRMATGMGMVALNDAVVLGIAAIGFMAYINIRLTALVMIPMPLIIVATRWLGRKMHRQYQAVQAAFSDLTESSRERVTGIRLIKAHNWENVEAAAFEKMSSRYVHRNLELIKVVGAFFPMMLLLTNLSLALVIYFGGRKTIVQSITPGDFVAFISYLGLLTWPMMAMGWVTNLIQRGRASLDRLAAILETRPAIASAADARRLTGIDDGIEFSDVSFRHTIDASDPPISALTDLNLRIEAGNSLGIVGPPGSGKTSLLNLIPRLYDVTAGQITIDGTDIRDLNLADLRSLVAFVPQEPFIFAGTVRQNITIGSRQFSKEMLMRAAEKAALLDTIQAFPRGLDTVVGEKGVMLSGGQKQRIALARAFLKDAPILILDDPNSQLDFETGARVMRTVKELAERKTVVVASHRISAVLFADRIISIDKGRLVESGTHQQLLQSNGYYARAFRLQELEAAPSASSVITAFG